MEIKKIVKKVLFLFPNHRHIFKKISEDGLALQYQLKIDYS